MKTESLSLHEARTRALAAQGFDRKRGTVDAKAVERVVAATQLFQIDSVSVVVRAHYLPLFSRLGVYDRGLLDEAAWCSKRSLFEYWAHEASLVPFAMQPLFRWRMRRASTVKRADAGSCRHCVAPRGGRCVTSTFMVMPSSFNDAGANLQLTATPTLTSGSATGSSPHPSNETATRHTIGQRMITLY